MGETEKDRIDDDILQCRMDVSRARGIIPPLGGSKPSTPAPVQPQEPKPVIETKEQTPPDDSPQPTPVMSDIVSAMRSRQVNQRQRVAPADVTDTPPKIETDEPQSDVPQFDLADQIMAAHRKVTSLGRKAPGATQITEQASPQKDVRKTTASITPRVDETSRMISQIVKRDIERICGAA